MKRLLSSTLILVAVGLLMTGCKKSAPPPPKAKKQTKIALKPEPKPKVIKLPKEKETRLGTIGYLDSKNGLRDVTFGVASDIVPGLVLVEEDEGKQLRTYVRSNDDLSLGDMPLTKIEYTFFEDKLCQVTLYWNLTYPDNTLRMPPTTELAGQCTMLYGRPAKRSTTKDSTYYVWSGKKVGLMITELRLPGVDDQIRGDWGVPPTTTGEMVIYSQPIRRNATALIASSAAKISEGL